MQTSTSRGHDIVFKDGKWIFKDTGLSVKNTYKEIPCGCCGKNSTIDGHDNCLGTLIGVMNACCGHGGEAYVQFLDGTCIRGSDAIIIIDVLKKYSK